MVKHWSVVFCGWYGAASEYDIDEAELMTDQQKRQRISALIADNWSNEDWAVRARAEIGNTAFRKQAMHEYFRSAAVQRVTDAPQIQHDPVGRAHAQITAFSAHCPLAAKRIREHCSHCVPYRILTEDDDFAGCRLPVFRGCQPGKLAAVLGDPLMRCPWPEGWEAER